MLDLLNNIVYFLVTGSCGYVLPRFNNQIYSVFKAGEHFGHVDLGDERELFEGGYRIRRTAISLMHSMTRRFTVQAFANCDLLALSVKDILKMKLEFPNAFSDIFNDVRLQLKKDLLLKLEVIKQGELQAMKKEDSKSNKLTSNIAFTMIGGLQKEMKNINIGQAFQPMQSLGLKKSAGLSLLERGLKAGIGMRLAKQLDIERLQIPSGGGGQSATRNIMRQSALAMRKTMLMNKLGIKADTLLEPQKTISPKESNSLIEE
jgi:hypothetical protein